METAVFRLALISILNWPRDTRAPPAFLDPILMEYLYRRLGTVDRKSDHVFLTLVGIKGLLGHLPLTELPETNPADTLLQLESEQGILAELEESGNPRLTPYLDSIRDQLGLWVPVTD